MRKTGLLALSVLGLFDSLYLLWVYTSPSHPMACLGTGCDVARASAYAHLAGIPTPAFGVALYGALVLLVFAEALSGAALAARVRWALVGVSAMGFGGSLFLSGIEAFVLHSWCVWCVVSAACVTGIFVLAVWELWRPAPPPPPGAAVVELRRHFAVVVAGIVIGIPAFLLLAHSEEKPAAPPASASVLSKRLIRPDSHVFGNPQASVTVVEFGDFQCPYCGDAEQAARQVRRKYGNSIRFVFRQFPLAGIHVYSEKAAEASECAAQQGKFWQAVDEFYDHQTHLTVPDLEGYARDLGLDPERFDHCLESGAMSARVRQDIADGRAVGVTKTPTFFVDGRKIEGALSFAQFSQLLDQELTAHGTPPPPSLPAAGAAKAPAQHTAKTPEAPPTSSGTGLLGGGGNVFSSFQGSGGCSEQEAEGQQPTLISTAQARRLFEGKPQALFVDVRPARQYARTRIRGAISLPSGELTQKAGTLPKDRTLVLYESGRAGGGAEDVCAAGRAAGRYLLQHGYLKKYTLVYKQGLRAWEEAGLPVQHGALSQR